jgi:SMC interacting uncharacterized protein involved in chromosome segregation
MAYYDADGNEVEAFSKEEVATQIAAKETELETLKREKDELAEKVNKAGDKDVNFNNLKKALAEKDEDIKNLSTKIEEVNNGRINEIQNDILSQIAGEDKELRESILKEMDTFRDKPTTKEGMQTLALKALAIVKPAVVEGAMDSFRSANMGGSFRNMKSTTDTEIKTEIKPVANNLGISDDDWKKYGGAK